MQDPDVPHDGALGAALGEADLSELADRVLRCLVAKVEGDATCREQGSALIGSLESTTRALAERTFREFSAEQAWTVGQRQDHALRAIVGRVRETRDIFAASGLSDEVTAPVVDFLREVYFARLAEIARGALSAPGRA
jgi:hypothetical protein